MTAKEWFSAQELAEAVLPGLPSTTRGVAKLAQREGWERATCDVRGALCRPRTARGGGVEYHYTVLPQRARDRLLFKLTKPTAQTEKPTREAAWRRWEQLPNSMKAEAHKRLEVILQVEQLVRHGVGKAKAITMVVEQAAREARLKGGEPPFRESTLYAWLQRIIGVRADDRVAYLAPDHVGRTACAEIPSEAWDAYKLAWLRQEQPTHAATYRYVKRIADDRGWSLPSPKTFVRRIEKEIPRDSEVLKRQGPKAAKHTVAHADRVKTGLRAMDVANLDGHTWDVFCLYEDGVIDRPISLAVQDIFSGQPLAIRFDRTLNHHIVRLALADTFRNYGLVGRLIMDNGRENQAKEISGQFSRFRKRASEEEPAGILKLLNIEPVFATPYHGQAKPIERMFRNWAQDIAKHPAFAGAYVGNKPTAKPENYRSRAIPIAEFEAIVREEMVHYSQQTGRRGAGMNGRSFAEVFSESVAAFPPRRVTAEQLRLCLLSAKVGAPDRRSGALAIDDHRYWSPELSAIRRQRLVVRFDPQDLSETIYVYDLQGRFLCTADRTEQGSFDNLADAQRITRARQKNLKKLRDATDALMGGGTVADVAAALPRTTPEPVAIPEGSNVVRLATGVARTPEQLGTARQRKTAEADKFNEDWARGFMASVSRAE